VRSPSEYVGFAVRSAAQIVFLATAATLAGKEQDRAQSPSPTPPAPVSITRRLNDQCKETGKSPDCPIQKEEEVDTPGYERGVLLVKLKPALAAQVNAAQASRTATGDTVLKLLPSSFQKFARQYRVSSITPAFDPRLVSPAHFAEIQKRFPQRTFRGRETKQPPRLDDIFKVRLDPQVDLERAAKELAADPQVIFAQPNRRIRIFTSDQYYNANDLWGLFKIQAAPAWNSATGAGVLVAVVDTGLDITHTDIQANLWTNSNETNPTDNIDNDNNGFVDDIHGWDFAYGSNSLADGHGHGTHVAGTIAAVANNTNGVVGLAYQSKVMPIKAFNNSGAGLSLDGANGMLYAINNGADVINNSWGGPDDPLIRNMVDSAHAMGLVVVSAAGNANTETCDVSPANAENGLTISGFTPADIRASFSNFGVKIDMGAPGGTGGPPGNATSATDILSTVPLSSALASYGFPVLTGGDNKNYIPLAGTSMAAPHVAALAALLIQAHPTWTNEQIRQAMRQSADDVSTPGFDTDAGYGRINAANALALGPVALPTALLQEPHNCKYVTGSETVYGLANVASGAGSWTIDAGPGDVPAASSFVAIGNGATPVSGAFTVFQSRNFPDGRYNLRVTTTDSSGKKSEDRNLVIVHNVFISTPSGNQIMSGSSYVITGVAAGNLGFVNYKLEWAPGCNATTGFQPIVTSNTQVGNLGPLGTWNLTSVSNGPVTLRLTANFSGNGGFISTDQKCVIVDKHLASGWPVAINQIPSLKSPKIADLDGDGTNEIILGASVFEPNGSLRTGWNNFPGFGRTNPAILDVDGTPGTLEVVAAVFDAWYNGTSTGPNNGAPVIYAYKPDKTVLWSYPLQNPNTTSSAYNHGIPSAISAADVDGDGKPDIVFTMFFSYYNPGPNYQTWVFILDASTGALKKSFPVVGVSRSAVALPDLDKNGVADLIVESWLPGNGDGLISVVDGAGNPLPGWPAQILAAADTSGFSNVDPVLTDIDGDGFLEVLVGKHLLNHSGSAKTGWPTILLSRSTGVMAPIPDADCEMEAITGGGNSVVFWDVEHTGQVNFAKINTFENCLFIGGNENLAQGNPVVADIDGDQQVEILRPSELGSLTPNIPMPLYGSEALSPTDPIAFPRFVITNPTQASEPIRSTAAVGDVDKDGRADLLVAAGGQLYLWNLNQPFAPSLSFWPMFQHDLCNTGVASSNHWVPDLYMQDTPADTGLEPDTVSSALYISSDIWVRTAQDTTVSSGTNPGPLAAGFYMNEHQHQNPVYVNPTTPNYLYAKVRNRSCKSSTGGEVLRIYWADASTGLPWPGTGIWNQVDCVAGAGTDPCPLPVIAPGQDYVVQMPWVPPNPGSFSGATHFCLVARIETQPSAPYGMTFPEGPLLWQNVAENNNIVWKNVTVIDGSGSGHVNVSNPTDHPIVITLRFAVPPLEQKDHLLLHGDVSVKLGDALINSWRRTGRAPRGFTVTDKATIKITDPRDVVLDGVALGPREKRMIEIQIRQRPGDKARPGAQFNWDITESVQLKKGGPLVPIGGERYILTIPGRR
jgi:subtilisin family serine protease